MPVILVWYCDECDYWRQEETSGVHVVPNPDDPGGAMVTHKLRERTFYSEIDDD